MFNNYQRHNELTMVLRDFTYSHYNKVPFSVKSSLNFQCIDHSQLPGSSTKEVALGRLETGMGPLKFRYSHENNFVDKHDENV